MSRVSQENRTKGQRRGRSDKDERSTSETISLVDEELKVVGKREVETGRVRVSKRVVQKEQVVHAALRRDDVVIERVRCDRVVDQASPIRTEGDVTIVPVYEEMLVKQLVLKEELRITRRRTVEQRHTKPVALRSEQLAITRTPQQPTSRERKQ